MSRQTITPTSRRAPLFARLVPPLVLAAVVATFLLIVLGAVVRVSGSGLGCPDWPLCHGRLIPPLDVPTLIEYSHRLAASLVSVLVLATGLAVWFGYRSRPLAVSLALLAVALLVVQVVLGGVTVLLELPPDIVTAHLGTALALLATLMVLLVVVVVSPVGAAASQSLARLQRLSLWAAGATYLLMLTGAYVRGSGGTFACLDWPLCQGGLLPAQPLALLHVAHRYLAVGVGVLLAATFLEGWRQRHVQKALGQASLHTGILFGLQVIVGAIIAWTSAAPWAQATHLAVASAVWMGVMTVAALAWLPAMTGRRLEATSASAQTLERGAGASSGGRGLGDYIALMKPRIIVLLLVTALGGMFLAAGGMPPVGLMAVVLVGGTLAAGGANALNHYYDQDIDSMMRRTQHRPIPGHRVLPQRAFVFGLVLNVLAFLVLATFAGVLSAVLALGGTLFYVLVYTRWLKRTTPHNIVIGGAAGAFPPLVGWAAVTGGLALPAWYLFAIIFFWTPPHFWALAWLMRDDYAEANVPMLPVVADERDTAWQILLYTIVLVPLTALLFTTRTVGWVYLGESLLLGGVFIAYAAALLRDPSRANASRLYRYSLLYLTLLFVVIMVESVVML